MREDRTAWSVLLFIAGRNLWSRRMATGFLIIAVTAGIGFQVPVNASLVGYRNECIEEAIDHGEGDIRIRSKDGAVIENAGAVAAQIRRRQSVVEASPMLTVAGAMGAKGRFHGVAVNGIEPGSARLPYQVVEGENLRPDDAEGIVVGSEVADMLGLRPGDEVQLRVVLSAGPALLEEDRVGRYSMVVRGVATGVFFAFKAVFVSRAFLSGETGVGDDATAVLVHLRDHDRADAVASELTRELPSALVRSWRQDSAYLRSAIGAVEAISAITSSMVVVAVAVPVLALLFIAVMSRQREIALLVGLGFARRELFLIYLLQGVGVGSIGSLLGSLLALGLILWLRAYPLFEWQGFVVRPELALDSWIKPTLLVLATAVFAGAYPALRAARLDPSTVLRSSE